MQPPLTVGEVRKAVAYKLKLEADIEVYKSDTAILGGIIRELRYQITQYKIADTATQHALDTYEKLYLNREEKIKVLEKEVKKWRRKQFWTGVVGIVTTLAGVFLYITK